MAGNHCNENDITTKQQNRNRHSFAASDSASIVNVTDFNKSYDHSAATNGTNVIRKVILLDPDKLRQFGLDMKIKKAAIQNIESPVNNVFNPANRTIKLVQKVKLTSALSPKRAEKIPETSINLHLLQEQVSNKLKMNSTIPSLTTHNQTINSPPPINISPTTNNRNRGMISPCNIKIVKIIPKGAKPGMSQTLQDTDNGNFKGWSDDKIDPAYIKCNNKTNTGSPISKFTAKRLSDVIKSKSSSSPKQENRDKELGVITLTKGNVISSSECKITKQIEASKMINKSPGSINIFTIQRNVMDRNGPAADTDHRLVPKQIEVSKMVKSPGSVKNIFTIQGAIMDRTAPPAVTYDINSIPTCSKESIVARSKKKMPVPTATRSSEQCIQTIVSRTAENRVSSLEFTKIPAKSVESNSSGRKPQKLWSKFNKFKKRNKKLEMENLELKNRLYSLMENMSNENSPNQFHVPFEEKATSNVLRSDKTRLRPPSPTNLPQVKHTPLSIVGHNNSACDKAYLEEAQADIPSSVVIPIQELEIGRLHDKKNIPNVIASNHQITNHVLQKPIKADPNKSLELNVNKNNLQSCKSVIIERIESPQRVVPVITTFNDNELLVPEIAEEFEISDFTQNSLEQNDEIDVFSLSNRLSPTPDSNINVVEEAQDNNDIEMYVSADSSREHDYSMQEISVRDEIPKIVTKVQEVESIDLAHDSSILGELTIIKLKKLEENSISDYHEALSNPNENTVSTNSAGSTVSVLIQESTIRKEKSNGNQILLEPMTQVKSDKEPEETFVQSYSPIAPIEISINPLQQIPESSNEVEMKPVINVVVDLISHDETQISQLPCKNNRPGEPSSIEASVSTAIESISIQSYHETENEPQQFNKQSYSPKASISNVLQPLPPVRIYLNKKSLKVSNLNSTTVSDNTEVIETPITKIKHTSNSTNPHTIVMKPQRQRKTKRIQSPKVDKTKILDRATQGISLIVDTEDSEEFFIEPPAYSPITPVEISINPVTSQKQMLTEINKEVLFEPTRNLEEILECCKMDSLSPKEVLIDKSVEIPESESLSPKETSVEKSLEVSESNSPPPKEDLIDKSVEIPESDLPLSNETSIEKTIDKAMSSRKLNKRSKPRKASIGHMLEVVKPIQKVPSSKKPTASNLDSNEAYLKTDKIELPITKIKEDLIPGTPDTSVKRSRRQLESKRLPSPESIQKLTPLLTQNRRRSRKSISPTSNYEQTSHVKTGKCDAKPTLKPLSRKRTKLEVENVLVQSDEDEFLGFPDNIVIPLPMNELVIEIKKEPDCEPNTDTIVEEVKPQQLQNNVTCGNCKESLLAKKWPTHLRKHNGIGFREGLDQPIDFTDFRSTLNTMIIYMKVHKITQVSCEKCGTTRKSALGMMSHTKICGLSEEEQRVPCVHCGNRLLPTSLHYHWQNSCPVLKQNEIIELMQKKESEPKPEEDDEEEESELNKTNSGRAKRKSVKAAEMKIKNFIELIDDVNLDDHFTEKKPFKISGGTKRGWTYQLKNAGIIKCRIATCDYTTNSIQQMSLHSTNCQNNKEVYGFYCRHCKFYSLLREAMVEHISKEHGNSLRNMINLECHSGSEASAGEESSESDGTSGEDEIEFNGGSDFEDDDGDMMDEDSIDRSRIRSSAGGSLGGSSEYKTTDVADALLRDYSLLIKQPQMTSSFYHFAFRWTADFIEKHFASDPLYINFQPKIMSYISETDAKDYIPITKISPKFSFRMENVYEADFGRLAKKVTSDQWDLLQLFKGKWKKKHNIIFYCGGPILCLDWATFPVSYKDDQYLAVSCYRDYNDSTRSNELQTKKGLIQVWNLGDLAKEQEPTMKYAFKVDFGPVCDIQFCPSGGYIPEERIGLLAVTSLVGDVYIYSLPHNIDEQQTSNIIELQPSITLRPCVNDSTKCRQAFRLTWTKDKGHSIIAAGYTDGWVAVWNLKTESKLLKKIINGRPVIIPTKIFHPFSGTIRGIEIFHVNNSQWLMVAADKNVKLFDLKTYPNPQEVSDIYQKSTITCSAWSIHWPGYLLGLNESFCLLRNSVTLTQPHEIGYKNYPMQSYDATVTDIAVSDYLNAYAATTDSGDIISYLPRDLLLNISRKGNRRIKFIVGFTDVIDLETEQTSDIPSKFGVLFCDLADPVLSSLNDLKSKRHRRWTLEQYPIVTITRIKFNMNRHFHKYYALGMQAGFVRIRYMVPRSGCYN